MALLLYNSITRQKEEFKPLKPPKVLFYNCGPTVYGEFHIGNARNFVVFDVIRRWLMKSGYEVDYVQNITDVDDKIIDRANKEGVSTEAITEKYTAYFFEKLKQLGNLQATANPKATTHIGAIIGLIKKLVDKGHAYPTDDGSVWFEVASFKDYGKLSKMPLDQMRQGERIDADQQKLKKSPMDFCLWKAAKPGEPAWKSPWGEGRPGWHIECSCMSMKALNSETLDIHAGGVDLRFPHHENEIAQSEAATGKEFARYWLHNGMLDIDGEKMSKSLGNFKVLDDILTLIDPLTLRYFLISARYRDKLDFSKDNLHKCQSAVERIVNACREAARTLSGQTMDEHWKSEEDLCQFNDDFTAAMNDDINTPMAIGELSKLVTHVNTVRTEVENGQMPSTKLARSLALLQDLREVLGLSPELELPDDTFDEESTENLKALVQELVEGFDQGSESLNPPDLIQLLIDERTKARKEKNFQLADQVRDKLSAIGITLEDKPGETIWKRA